MPQKSERTKLDRRNLEESESDLIRCLLLNKAVPKNIDQAKARAAAIALHEKKQRQKQKGKGQFNEYLWHFH
jgi:hypothetical protein